MYVYRRIVQFRLTFTLSLLALLGGCAASSSNAPATPAPAMSVAPWVYQGLPGKIITTEHYRIHTTVEDPDFVSTLAEVMEGAYQQYRKLTPTVQPSNKLMDCYVFSRRFQWVQFTKDHTGPDAAVYLQINRGGYAIRDWYVSYFIGDVGTYSVAAHEGWHQYVARHFHSRLPPFMEEGIATMFENITWPQRQPRWDISVNLNRADKLKSAIEKRQLWPLEQLCTMHAGDVVGLPGERIETFYAQNWAFAQFLLSAENGKYRPAFQRMLHELANGDADAFTGRRPGPPEAWDPRTVRPLLEHYLGMNMKGIDAAYQKYIRQLASGTRDWRAPS